MKSQFEYFYDCGNGISEKTRLLQEALKSSAPKYLRFSSTRPYLPAAPLQSDSIEGVALPRRVLTPRKLSRRHPVSMDALLMLHVLSIPEKNNTQEDNYNGII